MLSAYCLTEVTKLYLVDFHIIGVPHVVYLQAFANRYTGVMREQFVNLLIIIGYFMLICVIVTLISKDIRLKKFGALHRTQEEIVVQQHRHHMLFLKREEATRKFRHDIAHHFICIAELIRT